MESEPGFQGLKLRAAQVPRLAGTRRTGTCQKRLAVFGETWHPGLASVKLFPPPTGVRRGDPLRFAGAVRNQPALRSRPGQWRARVPWGEHFHATSASADPDGWMVGEHLACPSEKMRKVQGLSSVREVQEWWPVGDERTATGLIPALVASVAGRFSWRSREVGARVCDVRRCLGARASRREWGQDTAGPRSPIETRTGTGLEEGR